MIAIRQFQPEDTGAVVALWDECELIVRWNNPHRDIERKLARDPDLFLVATLSEDPAAPVVGTVMAGYEGHRGWINYLAVAPSCRLQGTARMLMAAAEEKLRALGCPKINLQVRVHNQETIEAYKALGYKVDAVIGMGKRLEEDPPPDSP